eukprot:7722483-Pyramimonas_sp.AAC.1
MATDVRGERSVYRGRGVGHHHDTPTKGGDPRKGRARTTLPPRSSASSRQRATHAGPRRLAP